MCLPEVECEEGFEPKNCSSEMAFQCDLVCGSPQNETMCAQQMCNPSMCVCKDGLYREGSRCIPKEDCGCFKSAEDGYFKVKSNIILTIYPTRRKDIIRNIPSFADKCYCTLGRNIQAGAVLGFSRGGALPKHQKDPVLVKFSASQAKF